MILASPIVISTQELSPRKEAIIIFDHNWNFLYISEEAKPFFQTKNVSQLIGKNIWKEYPQLEGSVLQKNYLEVESTKQPMGFDFFASLTGIWYQVYISPYKELGIIVYLRDISDAKRNQEELQTYKERLEQAQTAGEIGIFDWNMKVNQIYWSTQQEELLGMTPGSFSGKFEDWEQMLHPDDIARVKKNRKLILAEHKTSITDDFRVIYPDKSAHWILLRAKIYYDSSGDPIRMIGVNMDITEQRQTELYRQFFSEASKILSSSLDYQSTLNSVARLAVPTFGDWCTVDLISSSNTLDLVAVAHRDPKKTKWAKNWRNTYPPDLHNTTSGISRVISKGKSEIYQYITDAMIQASVQSVEQQQLVKDLHFRSMMIIPLKRKQKIIGTMTFVTDTDQRHYNETDLQMAEELAERASLSIENAKLFSSEQKAVQSRDEFLSIASHELKTPITVIKGFSQILQRRFQNSKDKGTLNLLQRIEVQVERLTKLINEILDVTKIEAGKMSFTYEAQIVTEIIEEVVSDIRLMKTPHELLIQGASKQMVLCDQERIRQVLNNLLSNAIKYSLHEEKIIVHIKDTPTDVVVSVQDFGIGIEKEYQPQIFQRFFRANAIEGTLSSLGLGLFISSEIIARHKGKIWVDSEKDKGATFSFSLPVFK